MKRPKPLFDSAQIAKDRSFSGYITFYKIRFNNFEYFTIRYES